MSTITTPTVSVVIPTFEEGKYIIETIEKLSNQTLWPQTELIIADYDPKGTHDTIRGVQRVQEYILKTGHVRFVPVYQQGIGIARHIGCQAAMTNVIMSFDADSYFEDVDAMRKLVAPLVAGGPVMTHCNNLLKDEDKKHQVVRDNEILYTWRNVLHQSSPLPVVYEPGLTIAKYAYDMTGYKDVVWVEGPLLGFDVGCKFGFDRIKHVDVDVRVSGRRFIGSRKEGMGVVDLNYNRAYR